MSSTQDNFYCHNCRDQISPITEGQVITCPKCNGDFIEIMENSSQMDGRGEWCACEESDFSDEDDDSVLQFEFRAPMDAFSSSTALPSADDEIDTHGTDDENLLPLRRIGRLLSLYSSQLSSLTSADDSSGIFNLHGNADDYAWGPDGMDDVITQLLSQLDTTGPPPTSKTAIEALPTVVIDQSEVDSGRDCSVCMELFKKSDSAKKLPCQHFFHIPCIDPWLALHNTCPICRKVVETTAPSCGQSTSTGPATSSTNADTSRSSPSTPANSLSC